MQSLPRTILFPPSIMSSKTAPDPMLSMGEVDSEKEHDTPPNSVSVELPLHPAARAYTHVRSFYQRKAPALPPIKLLPNKAMVGVIKYQSSIWIGNFFSQRRFVAQGSAEIDDRKCIVPISYSSHNTESKIYLPSLKMGSNICLRPIANEI